jgi:hypothetical protein
MRPPPSASSRNLSGVELTSNCVAACVPGALDFADNRQDVGGELARLGLQSPAHALYGTGGVGNETKTALGVEKLDAVADRGYFNSEEILACEEAGITVTLPKPLTSNAKAIELPQPEQAWPMVPGRGKG